MRVCESVAVIVHVIRSTGALDPLWSTSGTRAEVRDRAWAWQSAQPGGGYTPSVTDAVEGLPCPPDRDRWLNAVGVSSGQLWVWVTSSNAAERV